MKQNREACNKNKMALSEYDIGLDAGSQERESNPTYSLTQFMILDDPVPFNMKHLSCSVVY